MKVAKAIEILRRQKEDLKNVNLHTYEAWRNQTATYIKEFLGQTNEYLYIKDLGVIGFYKDPDVCEQKIKEFSLSLDNLLDRCIDTIGDIGLRKENFLRKISDNWLIAIIPILFLGLLTIGSLWGKYLSDTQNMELKIEVKKLKDSLGRTPTNISINNEAQKTVDTLFPDESPPE